MSLRAYATVRRRSKLFTHPGIGHLKSGREVAVERAFRTVGGTVAEPSDVADAT
jgi:hypothetical protein